MSENEGMADGYEGWWRVSDQPMAPDSRLHTRIQGRYVTIFKTRGQLSCIDSVCHHTGGDLANGGLMDIEDLGVTVVSCPLHMYKIDLQGRKVFQSLYFDPATGKPGPAQWKLGKLVQRAHDCREQATAAGAGVELRLRVSADEPCSSDRDASSDVCGQHFALESFVPLRVE